MRKIVIRGTVIEGKKRGKQLGYPTANTVLPKPVPEGIYASVTTFAGKTHESVTFIGAAKTFGESSVLAETYVLDFSEAIYGREIEVTLLTKLRDNRKFDSAEALIGQIVRDVAKARRYFRSINVRHSPELGDSG